MKSVYTITYKFEYVAGEPGWSYVIHDSKGQFRGQGWSRGSKRNAELEVRSAIQRLEHKVAA